MIYFAGKIQYAKAKQNQYGDFQDKTAGLKNWKSSLTIFF